MIEEVPEVKKNRALGFIIAFFIPLGAIGLSVYLVSKDISLNDLIFSKERKTEEETLGDNTEQVAEPISPFKDALEPILTKPSSLDIPDIALNVDLISVGVTDDGTMETPQDWYVAGWYKRGGMPGEKDNNLIINGHYDTNTGAKAAFYNLKNVEVGDKVEVKDEYGRIFTYEVLELEYVDVSDPSRLEVLESEEGKSTLTLITCGGIWTNSGYSKRLVVKADLRDKEPTL